MESVIPRETFKRFCALKVSGIANDGQQYHITTPPVEESVLASVDKLINKLLVGVSFNPIQTLSKVAGNR